MQDREIESEGSWRSFMMVCMMKMDNVLKGLVRENEELQKEVREMWKENTEDRWEFFREVGKVWMDTRVMDKWVRRIVEWVEDKKLEEESEEESEWESGDGEMDEKMELGNGEMEEKKNKGEMESEEKSGRGGDGRKDRDGEGGKEKDGRESRGRRC